MSRSFAIGIVAVAALLAGGWALAFQEQKPEPIPVSPAVQQFSVSVGGDVAVMVEVVSGKTWTLHKTLNGTSKWIPADRINDPAEGAKYLRSEIALKEVLDKQKAETDPK